MPGSRVMPILSAKRDDDATKLTKAQKLETLSTLKRR